MLEDPTYDMDNNRASGPIFDEAEHKKLSDLTTRQEDDNKTIRPEAVKIGSPVLIKSDKEKKDD